MKKIFLLLVIVLGLAGCALNTRYISYTDQRFPPKTEYYSISIYPETQAPSFAQPYRVIGKVEISGHVGDGITAETLADKARAVARARGADAIINSRTETATYNGVETIPGRCGYYRCRPPAYIPYSDTVLMFRGELVAFLPVATGTK